MTLPAVRTRALAGAIVVAGMIAAGLLVSPSTLLGTVDSLAADPALFGLVVAGLYLVRPLLAWPTTPLAAIVGYGFGVAAGIPIALVGVVVTVLPVFVAVRLLVTDDDERARATETDCAAPATATALEGDDGGLLERAGDAVTRYYDATGPLRGVTASRLAPIPSDVATCAAAVSDVEPRHLVIGTAIGELPWTTAAVVVGASAATLTSSGFGEFGIVLSAACAVAAGLLLAGPAYRTLRARSRTTPERADDAGRSTDG